MKRLPFFFALFSVSSFSSSLIASTMDVPHGCGLEPSTFSYNPNNISAAISAGSAIYQNQASFLDWSSLFSAIGSVYSSSTMSTEGPDYVLQGVANRFKYDGSWFDWGSRLFTVRFGTSEFGSMVSTTSNWDNNAYQNLTFNYTYGPGLVWSSADGCMAKSVMVQKAPKITSGSKSISNGKIQANISYAVDQYSEAVQKQSTNVRITLRIRSDLFGTNSSTSVYNASPNAAVTISTQPNAGGGTYHVSATVSDGNYSGFYDLGIVDVPGDPESPCPSCNPN